MRLAIVALTIVALSFPLSGRAWAHAFLARAQPRVGSHITKAPRELRLTFTEPVEVVLSSVALTGPDHADIPLGKLRTAPGDKAVLIVPIAARLTQGAYHVVWHVVSVDTHRTQGDFTFTLEP